MRDRGCLLGGSVCGEPSGEDVRVKRPLVLVAAAIFGFCGCVFVCAVTGAEAEEQLLGPVRVAITVDDLPAHGDLVPGMTRMDVVRGVLKALKDNGVPQAYGFANGYDIGTEPDLIDVLKEWLKAGYPLGNHTYSHADLDKITAQAYIIDIEKMDRLLQTLTSLSPLIEKRHVFRYPNLHEGYPLEKRDTVRTYLFKNSYTIAEVSVDHEDWAWTNAYTRCLNQQDEKSIAWLKSHVVDAAEGRLRASKKVSEILFHRNIPQILLIHDGAFDAVMLDTILRDFRSKGVTFIKLDEALADPAYKTNPKYASPGGRTFLEQIAESRQLDVEHFSNTAYAVDRLTAVCEKHAKAERAPSR
jgi:peptidoglycan/xylan/chitin deacetylase (PgdA/CDA1 family)